MQPNLLVYSRPHQTGYHFLYPHIRVSTSSEDLVSAPYKQNRATYIHYMTLWYGLYFSREHVIEFEQAVIV